MKARGVPTGVRESGRGHGVTPYDWTGLTIIFTKEHDERLDGLDNIK